MSALLAARTRRWLLTAHVTSSVGWLGVVAAYLVLAIVGVTGDDPEQVRAVYLAMGVLSWTMLVPLSLASLVTGVLQALGSHWGLWQHYWVVVKLWVTVVASVVLLLFTETLRQLAEKAQRLTAPAVLESLPDPSPVLHAAGALVLLLVAVSLSTWKPRGLTRHGQRARRFR